MCPDTNLLNSKGGRAELGRLVVEDDDGETFGGFVQIENQMAWLRVHNSWTEEEVASVFVRSQNVSTYPVSAFLLHK